MTSVPRITPDELLAHDEWVRRLAKRLLVGADDAADIAQQTLTHALRSPAPATYHLRPWLETIAVRIAFRARKQFLRDRAALSDPELHRLHARVGPAVVDVVAAREIHGLLAAAVRELKPHHHEVILLRYFQALPPHVIAARLAVSVGAVRARLKCAHRNLRRSLDRRYHGDRRGWCAGILGWLASDPEIVALRARWSAAAARQGRGAARLWLAVGGVAAGLIVMLRPMSPAPAPGSAPLAAAPARPASSPAALATGDRVPVEPSLAPVPAPAASGGASARDEDWKWQLRQMLFAVLERSRDGEDVRGVLEIVKLASHHCPRADPADRVTAQGWDWSYVGMTRQGLRVGFGHRSDNEGDLDRLTIALDPTVELPFPYEASTTLFDVTVSSEAGTLVIDAGVMNSLRPDAGAELARRRTIGLGCRFWLSAVDGLRIDRCAARAASLDPTPAALIELPNRGAAVPASTDARAAEIVEIARLLRGRTRA